jgi:hypothetical protein
MLCARDSFSESEYYPAKSPSSQSFEFATKRNPLTKTPNLASLRSFDFAQDMLCGRKIRIREKQIPRQARSMVNVRVMPKRLAQLEA